VANEQDTAYLVENDTHVDEAVIRRKIRRGEILVAELQGNIVGWLRFGWFWDRIPFMNLLHVQQEFRDQGIGTALITDWERRMRESGHKQVMTSTFSSERAQHLYRKLGYIDTGSILLPGEPLEILFRKRIGDQ